MRVLELAFIFLIFICIISVAKSGKGKQAWRVKGKLSKMNGKPSRDRNGNVNFGNKMSIMLEMDGVQKTMEVKKADIAVPSKPPSAEDMEVAAYRNEKEGVFCERFCKDDQCEGRCKQETTDGVYYFTGGAAIYWKSNKGTIDAIVDQKDMTVTSDGKVKVKAKEGQKQSQNLHGNRIKQVQPKMAERLSKIKTTKSASRRDIRDAHKRDTTLLKEKPYVRERRALVPDVESDVAVIKLMLVLDLGFTERIADLVGNNVNDITAESEKFLALIVNEMAYHHGSLENYGNSFTLNGISHPMNMTVFLNSIVFPPLNTAGTEFVNFDWSEYHVGFKDFGQSSEKALFAYHYYLRNRYWYSEYPIYSFGEWLKNSGLSGYDVAHAITGYDLADLSLTYFRGNWYYREEETNVIGRAFIDTACKTQTEDYATRTGVSELFAASLSRLLSHELGHNFGSPHDDGSTSCPEGKYIMSPYFVRPSNATPDFNKFSSCSAASIASYLSSIPSSQFEECLYNNKPNNTEFMENFCQGTTGSNYNLTAQCKTHFGDSAFVCANGMPGISDGFVPFDGCRLDSSNVQPLLRCSDGGSCSTTNNVYTIWPGTPCLNQNETQGNRVCFNGVCSDPVDFC